MAGLLAWAVLIGYFALIACIASWLTKRWRGQPIRSVYAVIVFALLFPLPIIDEIVGVQQFKALCREGAVPRYDEAKVRGKSVYTREVQHPEVPRVMTVPTRIVPASIPIIEQTIDKVDKQTGEVLISYKAYEAKGGWFLRAIGLGTSGPFGLQPNSCRPNTVALFKELNVKSD